MSGPPPLWRWRLFIGWFTASSLAGIVCCLLPLMETLGYEYSLIVSLILSLGAGHLAACYPHRVRNQMARFPGARFPVLILYRRVLGIGLALAASPLVLSLLNSLRVSSCNQLEGLAFYTLMPVCSVVIATAVGLFVGIALSGSKSASIVWFFIMVIGLFGAFARFYSTPAVYVFGPFFGYFPGVLYDKLVHVEGRFITYRIATLLQTLAIVGLSSWLLDLAPLRFSIKQLRFNPWTGIVTCAFILAATVMYFVAPSLGHRTGRTELEKLLAYKVETGKLDLFFTPGTELEMVKKLTDDAAFSLHQVERYLDINTNGRIAVFFFANVSQKAMAIGAAGTNVAKPWRSEIYVIVENPPHSVLRHELAHAVAADLGSGPFDIAGSLGGLWPDPGRIEGLAVAAGGPRGDLTVHQWASAMKRLGLLMPLKSVFGLGFFNVTASASYTAAGSFSSFIHDKFGAKSLKTAYRTGDWKRATGTGMDSLEKQWLEFLNQVSFRDEDLAAAQHRFDRPAVIHSICVHEVARLRAKASQFADMDDWDAAFNFYQQAHERSGKSTSTRLQLFYALIDAGKTESARKRAHDLLADPSVNSVRRTIIKEILADLDVASGKTDKAQRVFADLALVARNEADRRRLHVKTHLAGLSGRTPRRLLDILAQRPGPRAMSKTLAALTIAESVHEMPNDPILTYMLARQHFFYRDFEAVISWLERANEMGLAQATDSIRLAARMLQAQSSFHLGRYKDASALFKKISTDTTIRHAARVRARDWEDRCEFHAAKRNSDS
ncbi:MAG: hypothetical protein GY847_16355 [Proteobacteria bacterium]|nr:hypothetical protein [Pseudomonadota bacterium]